MTYKPGMIGAGPPPIGTAAVGDYTIDGQGAVWFYVGPPLGWVPIGGATGALRRAATTGQAGFSLVNGTPNIISFTAPNDGNMHPVLAFGGVRVTSAETGGVVQVAANDPAGGNIASQLDAGAHGTGSFVFTARELLVGAGTTVIVQQSSALTVGAAVAWAELWTV